MTNSDRRLKYERHGKAFAGERRDDDWPWNAGLLVEVLGKTELEAVDKAIAEAEAGLEWLKRKRREAERLAEANYRSMCREMGIGEGMPLVDVPKGKP